MEAGQRIFVTGASGFIGGAIARELVVDTLAEGDLPACDAVVHCAARVEPWGSPAEFWRANAGWRGRRRSRERGLAELAAAASPR